MCRRLARLFVGGWMMVPRRYFKAYAQYSNEVTIQGDASRWRTDRFGRFALFWIWRTILQVSNWRKRQILVWKGKYSGLLAVRDTFGHMFVYTLIQPGKKFGLLKGHECSRAYMTTLSSGLDGPQELELTDLGEVDDAELPPDVLRI